MSDMEKVARERAYELWEHAGRPIDRSFEFWFVARAEFEVEKGAGQAQPGERCGNPLKDGGQGRRLSTSDFDVSARRSESD